jgi:crossover junction endodeoxyribonuclease RuvC
VRWGVRTSRLWTCLTTHGARALLRSLIRRLPDRRPRSRERRSTTLRSVRASFEHMFVLGIDPGLSRCGYGAVVRDASSKLRPVSGGVVTTPADQALPDRLKTLFVELQQLINELEPEVVVIEHVFFQNNARTAMSVSQASGLAMVVAAQAGCTVVQYTSNEVKQALVGYGGATKQQVQRMVASVLHLDEPPRPPDVADALALAVCHLTTMPLRRATEAALQRANRSEVLS